MHISKIFAEDFRRFTKLEIVDIPATARLVVLAGPNGNGKSSLFDIFVKYFDRHSGLGGGWEHDYHSKITDPNVMPAANRIDVEFHEKDSPADPRKRFYFRTAYRNQPEFSSENISPSRPALAIRRIGKFIENDVVVGSNYQRLYALGLESAFEDDENMQLKEFRRNLIGDVQEALKGVLPELTLVGLGNPFKVQTFRFSKGKSQSYNYMNLSGGEKAAFDLLLDFVMKKKEFDDTVFCIDEPEAHLNPRVQGKMLDALVKLTDAKSQLWIATHSIGMLRYARDLYFRKPGEVVFLDFDQDFDEPCVLKPIVPDRAFWERSLVVAFDDMAALVAPKIIVACESGKKDGKPGEGIDSAIYNMIFGREFPDARFVSIGAATHMEGERFFVLEAVAKLIEGTTVMRLIDRDGMTDIEKREYEAKGYRVLSRRHIESYLYDDEILERLCDRLEMPDRLSDVLKAKADALKAASENHPPDHMKAASGRLFDALRRILGVQGKASNAFMRDVLAPLVSMKTKVYQELRADVFGCSSESCPSA